MTTKPMEKPFRFKIQKTRIGWVGEVHWRDGRVSRPYGTVYYPSRLAARKGLSRIVDYYYMVTLSNVQYDNKVKDISNEN